MRARYYSHSWEFSLAAPIIRKILSLPWNLDIDVCQCDFPTAEVGKYGVYWCAVCERPVECELSYLNEDDNQCLAQVKHVDYLVCRKHERIAISNVHDRNWVDEAE